MTLTTLWTLGKPLAFLLLGRRSGECLGEEETITHVMGVIGIERTLLLDELIEILLPLLGAGMGDRLCRSC